MATKSASVAAVDPNGTVGMYRVKVSVSSGPGKLKTAVYGVTKEPINRIQLHAR
jgi:ATP-dependent Lon protease